MFVRFKQIKTALQHGVSLFKDRNDHLTCPLHSLAVALAMRTEPGSRLFPQFEHDARKGDSVSKSEDEPSLVDLLDLNDSDEDTGAQVTVQDKTHSRNGAQSYVNQLLTSVYKLPAVHRDGLTASLTSHSFRRGGAMHVNADSRISPQWVAERGGWNLTRVSKAFSYMLNTSVEDQSIARQLSGWEPGSSASLPELSCFDAHVRSRVARLQTSLFHASLGFATASWDIDPQVLDVLTASLLLHLPGTICLRNSSPFE